MIQIAETNYNP